MTITFVHLKLVVKVNFHRLSFRIVTVLIEVPLLKMLRWNRSSFEFRFPLVQFLHVVRIGRFGKKHDLLMRVARVTSDKLGRRLVTIHSATTLTLCMVGFPSNHSIELLTLKVCHSIHLLMKLFGPFLLIFNNLLACVTIHIRFCMTNTHYLWIRFLIIVNRLNCIVICCFILLGQLDLIIIQRVVF